ncbi:EAL domain-containing protein [Bradyrhizobium sp. WSM3983]|uniref:EAL domain-containing protein n=1 Tax=Bradyrhizobium sp. WSM3983 TaxID=1038867 RepID=UPI0004166504|nr:EAL domain-containing protein [Bradyrhizobium sp. WSM3983]
MRLTSGVLRRIDRISNLEATPQSAEIVRAVRSLAHALHIPVVAGGVETEARRAFLVQEACEKMQGYLTGRPEPIEQYCGLIGINVEHRRYA